MTKTMRDAFAVIVMNQTPRLVKCLSKDAE